MNNITLVQLIELNRRAQGYPPSPVTLPETLPKRVNKIEESDMIELLHKLKAKMESKERGAVASGN